MARPFRRTPGGYTASFEPAERDLIRELAEDVRALLRPADTTADGGTVDPLEALVGITENPTVPADSAVARLLPAASSDDETATFNRELLAKYEKNIFSVMEEVWASDDERIDLVIFLNGLAIMSLELKCNAWVCTFT